VTFKENCPDLRNSKVADIVAELRDFGCDVVVHDPLAEPAEALHEYGIELVPWNELPRGADAIVAAVPHSDYREMSLSNLLSPVKAGGVFIDVKSAFDPKGITAAELTLWRL
jgi:UDP-N-acetyl-D-galactosamine dehydrogenase